MTRRVLLPVLVAVLWLAPIAGTRFMVPYRVSLPTPMGQGVLQATQFITIAQSPRPTPASAVPTAGRGKKAPPEPEPDTGGMAPQPTS